MADPYPRDEAGFCRNRIAGHRLCRPPRDCRVADPDAAWEDACQTAIAVLTAKNRHLKREARRP